MPEIKNNFTSGKMNKDLDERLLPKNEYRNALNIDIATTEGSDIGSAQNSYGNVKVSTIGIAGARCVGSILNPENQKIIWFVSGTSQDVIAEYDQSTQQVEAVLVDNHGGNVSFLNFRVQNGTRTTEDNLITGINVIDGMLFFTDAENEPKKINIDRFKIGVDDTNPFTTTNKFVDSDNIKSSDNVLEEHITVVKQYPLDAPTLKLYRDIAGSGDPSSSTLTIPENTTRTSWGTPFGAGTTDSVEYYNKIWTRTVHGAVSSTTINFNQSDDGGNVQGSARWNNVVVGMTLCQENGFAIKNSSNQPIGITAIDANANSGGGSITLSSAPASTIANDTKVGFRWALSPHRNFSFWTYIDTNGDKQVKPAGATSNSVLIDEDENTIFDNKGNTIRLQQLAFTPRPNFVQDDVVVLTVPNTLTTDDDADEIKVRIRLLEEVTTGTVVSNSYRKVFDFKILSIDESIKQMLTSDLTDWEVKRETSTSIFEDKFPRFAYRWKYVDGEYSAISAFSEVAFLPTEEGYNFDASLGTNTNIVNTVSKVEITDFVQTPKDVLSLDVLIKFSDSTSVYKYKTINSTDLETLTTVEVTSDQIHTMLPSNQLLRPYDNVPKKAKAQEITANRLLYANYTNQYNIDEEPRFSLTVESNLMDTITAQKSVKSLRTYQLGASLLDQYGRQTPIFSQADSCSAILTQEESFTANNFFVKQNFLFPEWATHLKYYIKEPKGEYYNITMDRIYESDTEEFCWVSFPSSDINKVSEGDEIVLKKRHDGGSPFIAPKTVSYKVIAKASTAPEAIKNRKKFIGRIENQLFGSYADDTTGYPTKSGITLRIRGNDGINDNDALKNMADSTSANRYIRIGSYLLNTISNYYEIESIIKVDAGDGQTLGSPDGDYTDAVDYWEIILSKPFDNDINFVKGAPGSSARTEYFELWEERVKEFDEEFQGRFFVKILKDDYLTDFVTTVFGSDGINYGIKSTQDMYWIQNVYSSDDANDETGQAGNSADNNSLGFEDADHLQTQYTFPSEITQTVNGAITTAADEITLDAVGTIQDGATVTRADGSQIGTGIRHAVVVSITGLVVKINKNALFADGETLKFSIVERITQDPHLYVQNGSDTVGAPDVNGVVYKNWHFLGASDNRVLVPSLKVQGNSRFKGPQRYAIDQAWSWKQKSYGDTVAPPNEVNHQMGHGFKVGSREVNFRLFNLGPGYKFSSASKTSSDGYIFHDHKGGPDRKFITENFTLYQALGRKGMQFRWTDDPTETVYTVEKSELIDVNNYTNVGDDSDFDARENQGIKWRLKLDKSVAWSPTQQYYPEDGTNVANPGKIIPYYGPKQTGLPTNASELQILEPIRSKQSFNSFSPAVFEVQPKESSDLNLYYETPKSVLILKNDMYIERNVQKPNGAIDNNVFVADAQIVLLNSDLMDPGFYIKGNSPYNEQVKHVEEGSYITIYSKDINGNTKFSQKLLIVNSVAAPGTVTRNVNDGSSHTGTARNNFYYKIPLNWFNCYSYGNGVESNRIKDAFNEPTIDNGPRVSTTFMGQYGEETKPNGIIFSGIYNGNGSVNNLNQFIMAEGITKDLNPSYGSIQKLFTRNTNVISFCENKTLKILANKDALFNADGNPQLTATDRVLGQTVPFAGEFGISKNPESFASYGYRVYYTDKNRNAVLRLSGDGITNISDKGMSTFFKENLSNADNIVGSYDEDKDTYNLTLNSKTVSFSESVNGWTSLKSFIPENGFSVSGDYYTVKDGDLYQHNENLLRNHFYGIQYQSSIKFVFNDEPALIKNFNTLSYAGTASRAYFNNEDDITLVTNGWYADSIETSEQSGQVIEFKEKEGKWFNNIIGIETLDANVDTKEVTMQGLGTIPSSGVSVGDGAHATRYTHTVFAYSPESPDPTVSVRGGIYGTSGQVLYPTSETGNPAEANVEHVNTKFKPDASSTKKIVGLPVGSMSYLRNICDDLIFGETYTITADVTISANPNNKTVGFGGGGLPQAARIDSTGVISQTWTVTKTTGIYLFKGRNVNCIIDNISIMVTPQEQPRSPKFRINTSPNDATVTTFKTSVTNAADTTINNDAYNGGNDTVAFYVHPLVVNGAKWAVQASGVTVSESSDPLNFLRNFNSNKTDGYINNGSWTASNSYQGTHSNVVKVEINIVGTMPSWNIDSILKFIVTPTLTQS